MARKCIGLRGAHFRGGGLLAGCEHIHLSDGSSGIGWGPYAGQRPSRQKQNSKFWMTVLPCLVNFGSCFLLCPTFPIWKAYCQQLRQELFIVQWLPSAAKKVNSLWSVTDDHHFFWIRFVLPGTDMSHCHRKKLGLPSDSKQALFVRTQINYHTTYTY